MDFVNFASVEFVSAIEAERALERRERKWLRAWRQLERAQSQASGVEPHRIAPTLEEEPLQRAA